MPKEASLSIRHGGYEQIAIEEQVSHLAARLGDEQTTVACRVLGDWRAPRRERDVLELAVLRHYEGSSQTGHTARLHAG